MEISPLVNWAIRHPLTDVLLVVFISIGVGLFILWRRRSPVPPSDNGISVGAPKLYDTRSLVMMLDQLREDLRSLGFVDQKAVAAGLGAQQGETSKTLSISASVAPAVTIGKEGDSKKAAEDDAPKGADEKKDPASSTSKSGRSFGDSASDLLNDQINLTYQLFNTRLLLERALSDRLREKNPRLQSVIGIPITLDPPPFAVGCAATIEITLSVAAGSERPSLVALFPQEKTYNTTAVSSRSGAFGGAAVSGILKVSAGANKQDQFLYLYRETDTIALERMPKPVTEGSANDPAANRSITFGWQFRPVLGRRSVSPGARQVFAVIAVPADDLPDNDSSLEVKVSVRTDWRKYSATKSVVSDFASWRSIFSRRPTFQKFPELAKIQVRTTFDVEKALSPQIRNIQWVTTSIDTVVIIVTGSNFFPGTTVLLGGKNLARPEEGLLIKSDQSIQISAPLSALYEGNAVLNGRYGPAIPLEIDPKERYKVPKISISSVTFKSLPVKGARVVYVTIEAKENIDFDKFSNLPDPLIMIAGQLVPGPYLFSSMDIGEGDQKRKAIRCQAVVPADLLPDGSFNVQVKFPFFGDDWTLKLPFYDPSAPLSIVRFETPEHVRLYIYGWGFDDKWKAQLDKEYSIETSGPFRLMSPTVLTLDIESKKLAAYGKVALISPQNVIKFLDIPAASSTQPPQALNLDQKPVTVTAGENAVLSLSGSNLELVDNVTLNGVSLAFSVDAGGRRVIVLIGATEVDRSEIQKFVFTSAAGEEIRLPLIIQKKQT